MTDETGSNQAQPAISPATVRVRPAVGDDLAGIVRVHRAAFPGFFLTRMGAPFLRAYYRIVADFPDGILLVAEQGGTLVGLVAGFLDPPRFYEGFSAARRRLLWPLALGVVRDPRLIPLILANRRRVGDAAHAGTATEAAGPRVCELASIGVAPGTQGRGVGRALVGAFVETAAGRGARTVFLTTDDVDNDRAHAFYQGLGFVREGAPERRGSRALARYVRRLAADAPGPGRGAVSG